jgi:archaellum component FlaC
VEGYAFLAFAALLVLMAFLSPSLWWMVFVAIGFGLRGAQIIGFHRRKSLELSEADAGSDAVQEDDERADRINEVCDKLKAALKDAPASVRDFLSKPEETVESLRKTSLDLLKREVSLRVLISPSEVERLNRERTGLLARIEMESDDIIRQRLSGALAALENQQKQHTEVQRSADRLDAERTRLGYTLEGLYAQVMRVKTADAASSDGLSAGLRVSLDQLRDEMNALADAVEQVNRSSAARTLEAPETFESGSGERTGQKVR